MICIIFYILCIYNIIITVESTDTVKSVEVRTTLGKVKGKLVDDATTGAYYYSFEGIPYAEPPVGKLRFKPPVKKRAWSTVFDATKPGRVCPQVEFIYSRKKMDEDCLNFNIYTPANYLNKSFPVIFYIHGGDFALLSGNAEPVYGPQLLVQNDIVVVTTNYRLGALGFLSLCTEEISGNAGLKDVVLGLKIVNENIKRFGGDPNKITIMGNGAGAVMAELLMLTNQTIGLFNNVILHCGSVLSSKYIQLDPRDNALLLAQKLGLDVSNVDSMIKGLIRINPFEIVKAQEAIDRKDPRRGFRIFRPFKPTVEIEYKNAIITRPPLEMIREGAIRDVPMFIGFNNQEGLEMFRLLSKEPELIDRLNNNFELLIPADIKYPFGSVERRNLAARIKDFYFNGGNISFVNVENYINLISDSQYTFSIDFFIKLFKEKKSSSVYYYVFGADTELNWFKAIANITYPGAAQFDDVGYVFVTSVTKPRYKSLSTTAKRVQNIALLNTKHFINHGVPAPNPKTNFWPEAGQNRFHLILVTDSIPVFDRPLPERIGFWYSVYEEYFASEWNNATYFCTNDDIDLIL